MCKMIHGPRPAIAVAARAVSLPFPCCILLVFLAGASLGQDFNPYPREVVKTEKALEWTFPADAAAWTPAHDCTLTANPGALIIQCTSEDPYLFGPPISVKGPLVLRL